MGDIGKCEVECSPLAEAIKIDKIETRIMICEAISSIFFPA